MDTAALDTPITDPSLPLPDAVVPETIEPAASIADHASSFGPETPAQKAEREAANTGQFADRSSEGRHKAQSQRATPEDVAEINRLTKELRETEQRIGEKDPDAKVSPRIRTLRRQLAALKALDAPAQETKPAVQATKAPTQAVPSPASAFTDKEPTLDDFATTDDPYAAWTRAIAAYDRKKERFDEQQQRAQEELRNRDTELITAYQQRVTAFAAKTPDYVQVTAPIMERRLPAALLQAIARDDNGPRTVYYLAQHPDVLDDFVLQTAALPADADSVALVQRRLQKQVQAATTGSATPARPTYTPPRPPNPVRTGPLKTSDEPPGDGASIADHAKYYAPKR